MIALSRVADTATWKCLVDVYRSLGATIAIVGHDLVPLSLGTDATGAPALMDIDEDAAARAAAALANQRPTTIHQSTRSIAYTPVIDRGTVAGAVAVAGRPPQWDAGQLESASALLARTLEDELAATHSDITLTSRRVTALHQLLHNVGNDGTDREVVQQFAEALTVWEDAECFGYRGDLSGHYALAVTLPGSDRARVPVVIAGNHLPDESGLLLLSAIDREELGFTTAADIVLARVVANGASWLMAIHGAAPAMDRLELYVAALAVALPAVLARESARLTWTMMQQFVEASTPEEGARRIVSALGETLGATTSFVVYSVDHRPVFTVGQRPDSPSLDPLRTASVLRARVDADAGVCAVLTAQASGGQTFAGRELRLFEAAVENVRTWFVTAAPHLAAPAERRQRQRVFEQVLKQYVNDPDAALIVISPGDPASATDTGQNWIRHLRAQLRATDLAGRLMSGDVAVLALYTPPAGARAVAHRIAQLLAGSAHGHRPIVRVGAAAALASSSAGVPSIDHSRLQIVDLNPSLG